MKATARIAALLIIAGGCSAADNYESPQANCCAAPGYVTGSCYRPTRPNSAVVVVPAPPAPAAAANTGPYSTGPMAAGMAPPAPMAGSLAARPPMEPSAPVATPLPERQPALVVSAKPMETPVPYATPMMDAPPSPPMGFSSSGGAERLRPSAHIIGLAERALPGEQRGRESLGTRTPDPFAPPQPVWPDEWRERSARGDSLRAEASARSDQPAAPAYIPSPPPSAPAAGERTPAQTVTSVAILPAERETAPAAQAARSESSAVGSPTPGVRLVNSRRITLNYALKDVGPSGVADVELWYTRDGHTWQKHGSSHHGAPPYVVQVDDEDLYGFTLVARSGMGLGKRPPHDGDRPQVWVDVDTTKPDVRLLAVEPGRDAEAGRLTILWRATDKNLGPRPVTLRYAAHADGPWTAIASQIENTGRFVWQMPSDLPHHFLVRIDAVDQAGNVGTAQTPNPVLNDLAQPSASITDVETQDH